MRRQRPRLDKVAAESGSGCTLYGFTPANSTMEPDAGKKRNAIVGAGAVNQIKKAAERQREY